MSVLREIHLWTKQQNVWEGGGEEDRVEGKNEDKMGFARKLSQYDYTR